MNRRHDISAVLERKVRSIGLGVAEAVTETLWPTRCAVCDQPGALVCEDCWNLLPVVDRWRCCPLCGAPLGRIQCCECNDVRLNAFGYTSLPINGCRSAFVFTTEVGCIVRLWKDGGEQRLGSLMASAMVKQIEPAWWSQSPTVTPIPATKAAIARRGMDHGHLLAREVAKRLDLPYRPLLARPEAQDQRQLGRHGRMSNIQGKFMAIPHLMMPQAVLLVDDVCTTGSTLYGAAGALRAQGVKYVYGLTFARVL